MSVEQRRVRWYLRLSRILCVFPISRSKDGALRSSICSVHVLISIALAGFYTATTLKSLEPVVYQEKISYLITYLPHKVQVVFTNCLIRAASIYYSRELIVFLTPPHKAQIKGCQTSGIVRLLVASPIVFSLVATVRLIAVVTVSFPGGGRILVGGENQGSIWSELLLTVIIIIVISIYRDGAFFCAFWFVSLFGREVIQRLQVLCAEVMEYGEMYAGPLGSGPVFDTRNSFAAGKELTLKILKLKNDFRTYSNIGGSFSFSLVLYIATYELFSISAVLLYPERSGSTLDFKAQILDSVMAALMLLTVAEIGHQIGSKVQLCSTKS